MVDSERLKAIKNFLGANTRRLAEMLGMKSAQALYDVEKGRNGISKSLAEKIKSALPEISTVWLLSGEGEMFEHSASPVVSTPVSSSSSMSECERILELQKYSGENWSGLAKEIGVKSPQVFFDIKAGRCGISKNVAEAIIRRYPEINPQWLLVGNGDMLMHHISTTRLQSPIEYSTKSITIPTKLFSEITNSSEVLRTVMADNALSTTDVAAIIEESNPAVIDEIIAGSRNLELCDVIHLQERYPRYRLRWLVSGEGDKLAPHAEKVDVVVNSSLAATVERLNEEISRLREDATRKDKMLDHLLK